MILNIFLGICLIVLFILLLPKKKNICKERVCYHTKTDCEDCFSQNTCNSKDENILREKRRNLDV